MDIYLIYALMELYLFCFGRIKTMYQVLPRSVVPKHNAFINHPGTSAVLGLRPPSKPLKDEHGVRAIGFLAC